MGNRAIRSETLSILYQGIEDNHPVMLPQYFNRREMPEELEGTARSTVTKPLWNSTQKTAGFMVAYNIIQKSIGTIQMAYPLFGILSRKL